MPRFRLTEPVVMLATVLQWLVLATATGALVGAGCTLFLRALFASEGHAYDAPWWLLAPAYALLWLGGGWLRSRYRGLHLRELGLLAASALVATTACFIVSDSSYYWLSDSWMTAAAATRSVGGWLKNFGDWYWTFVRVTLAYVAVAAALHVVATLLWQALPTTGQVGPARRG